MLSFRSNSMQPYAGTTPAFDVRRYFDGQVKGWGLVQDWRGRVQSRFEMLMEGSWDGNQGTLNESFTYYSGRKDQRQWTLTVNEDGTFSGIASDIDGRAEGTQMGSAMFWNYKINIQVNGKDYLVALDDWIWRFDKGVAMNRAYIKKFGLKVGELTVFMQKLDDAP